MQQDGQENPEERDCPVNAVQAEDLLRSQDQCRPAPLGGASWRLGCQGWGGFGREKEEGPALGWGD